MPLFAKPSEEDLHRWSSRQLFGLYVALFAMENRGELGG